jgi:hypothetical protein
VLTKGENWLRLIMNGTSNRILQDTQDTAFSSENAPHPSIVSISDRSYPDNECYFCIDVDGPNIAVKDMRYPDDSNNDLQVFIVRRSEQSNDTLEELPRRQMRLLRSGDCLVTRHEGSKCDEVDLVLEYLRSTGPPPQSQIEAQLSQDDDVPNETQNESPRGEAMDVDARSEEDLLEGDDMETYEEEEREEEDTQQLVTSPNISTLTDEGQEFIITQAAGADKEHDDDSSSTTLDTNDFQNAETQFGAPEADEEEARNDNDPEATQAFHMPEPLLTQSPQINYDSQILPSADGSIRTETDDKDESNAEHRGHAAVSEAPQVVGGTGNTDKDTTNDKSTEALAAPHDPPDESEKALSEQKDLELKHADASTEQSEVNAEKPIVEQSSPSGPKLPGELSTRRVEELAQESQQSVSLEDAIAAVNSRASQGVVSGGPQASVPEAGQGDIAASEDLENEGSDDVEGGEAIARRDSSSLSEFAIETQPEVKDEMSASSSLTDPQQSQQNLKRASEEKPESDHFVESQDKSEAQESTVDSPAATQVKPSSNPTQPVLLDETKVDFEETKINAEEMKIDREEAGGTTMSHNAPRAAPEVQEDKTGREEEQKEEDKREAVNEAEDAKESNEKALHEEPEDDMEVEPASSEVLAAAPAVEEESNGSPNDATPEVQASPANASPSPASPSENVTPEDGKKRVRTPVSTRASARKRSRQAVAADLSIKRSRVDSDDSNDIRVLFTGVIVTSQYKKVWMRGCCLVGCQKSLTLLHYCTLKNPTDGQNDWRDPFGEHGRRCNCYTRGCCRRRDIAATDSETYDWDLSHVEYSPLELVSRKRKAARRLAMQGLFAPQGQGI